MKKLNYFYLVLMALCTGFACVACGDDDDEPKPTIDPVVTPAEWVTGDYTGTTYTDLDSRGMVMRIDTTYDKTISLAMDSLGTLALTYPDWTDHTGMNYGDFRIVPLEATTTTDGVVIEGECTDSLYKMGVGYPATLRVEGTVAGEPKVADLTIRIDLAVSPKMTLKFTLTYEGTVE